MLLNVSLVTGRNEVVAKVMFLQVCVILFMGGCLPQCMLGYHTHTHPGTRHPLGPDPPDQTSPRDQTHIPRTRHHHPMSRHTPQDQTPPGLSTPPEAYSGIRSTSGRYASYWNAFLCNWRFIFHWVGRSVGLRWGKGQSQSISLHIAF